MSRSASPQSLRSNVTDFFSERITVQKFGIVTIVGHAPMVILFGAPNQIAHGECP